VPDLFDVVELTVDIPERGLRAGMQGTIVEFHPDDACEVEFTNELGETLDFLALRPLQFIVLWRAKTRAWVPLTLPPLERGGVLGGLGSSQVFPAGTLPATRTIGLGSPQS